MNLTLNEALTTLKTLKARHSELTALRDRNSETETRFYGANADKSTVKEPTYDVKALDRLVASVAKEIRLLELAIKRTNARVLVEDYEWNDSKLGEIA